MQPAAPHIGTSGWNYKHWRNSIYPEKLPQRQWLAYMVERFDTVEVNTSFYRIPKQETVANWQALTPARFLFALKLWRGITHYKKLLRSRGYTASFLDVVDVLEPKRRAPLLIQLPPGQGKNVEKLRSFLRELLEVAPSKWDIAVEFRNAQWLVPDVYRMLDEERASVCLHDMHGRGATFEPNDATHVYIRRHGSGEGRYAGSYSPEQLAADASAIRSWVAQGKAVYVYYNNDIGGHAFWNALELKRLCT